MVATSFTKGFFRIGNPGRVSCDAIADLKLARRGTHINALGAFLHKLIEVQRTVVERTREPETIIHKHGLPCPIAGIHSADLRNRRVGLVDD